MQFRLNFLFPKPDYNPQSRLFIERYSESQICLSKLLIESEEPKLDENQKIGECRKNCVTRSYADNLLKFRMQFCTPSKVKYKRSKPQGFFCWQFFFAAASFSLNNNICLFVCLFFFRMLSDNPVEFIGSEAFTVPRNDLLVQVFYVL